MIIIRDIREEELDSVGALLKEAYQGYAHLMPVEAWKEYAQDIMDVRARFDKSDQIVAEVDGHLAGSVTLYLKSTESVEWPAGWAGIRLLGVSPRFRGLGVGRALMDECVRRCREKGIKTIGLHTTTAMDVARRMYERMGFVREPKLDFHPREDIVVMAYRLDLPLP